MRKFGTLALVVGFLATACSGHSGSSALPSLSSAQIGGQPSTMGARTTMRPQSVAVAPAGWATTSTLAIGTSLANATDLGVLPSTQPVTVRLALQLRNADQLKQAVASGQVMSHGAFMSGYAPTSAQVSQVTSYLQSQGFTNIVTEPDNILVSGTATAAQVAKAFNTELHGFTQNGVNVYANTQPAYVPQALAGTVISVLGLNNAQVAKPGPNKKSSATPTPAPTPTPVPTASPTPAPVADAGKVNEQGLCVRFYDPGTFNLAYDAASVPGAKNTSVAIMTEGQLSGAIADFRTNEKAFNMGQVPVTIVPVGPMSSDTAGNDEWTLDMTYSTAMAGTVPNLYLYNFAKLSHSALVLAFSQWPTDD